MMRLDNKAGEFGKNRYFPCMQKTREIGGKPSGRGGQPSKCTFKVSPYLLVLGATLTVAVIISASTSSGCSGPSNRMSADECLRRRLYNGELWDGIALRAKEGEPLKKDTKEADTELSSTAGSESEVTLRQKAAKLATWSATKLDIFTTDNTQGLETHTWKFGCWYGGLLAVLGIVGIAGCAAGGTACGALNIPFLLLLTYCSLNMTCSAVAKNADLSFFGAKGKDPIVYGGIFGAMSLACTFTAFDVAFSTDGGLSAVTGGAWFCFAVVTVTVLCWFACKRNKIGCYNSS